MQSISHAGPEGSASIILVVAKDATGCWLVQEGQGRLFRHFASLEAALSFANRAPQPFTGAIVAVSCGPMNIKQTCAD